MVLDWRTSCPVTYDFYCCLLHFFNPYSDSHEQVGTRARASYTISDSHDSANTRDRASYSISDTYRHANSYSISDTYAHAYP